MSFGLTCAELFLTSVVGSHHKPPPVQIRIEPSHDQTTAKFPVSNLERILLRLHGQESPTSVHYYMLFTLHVLEDNRSHSGAICIGLPVVPLERNLGTARPKRIS